MVQNVVSEGEEGMGRKEVWGKNEVHGGEENSSIGNGYMLHW